MDGNIEGEKGKGTERGSGREIERERDCLLHRVITKGFLET
jgi:hypothetical protein